MALEQAPPPRQQDVVSRGLALLDRFVAGARSLDVDGLRRRRLLLISSALVTAFALFFAAESARASADLLDHNAVALVAGSVIAAVNAGYGQRRWPGFTGHVLVVIMLGTLSFLALTSEAGLWDASLWWQVVIPLVAAFLVSSRAAALCALAVIVEIGVLFARSDGPVGAADADHFLMLSSSSVVFTVTALAWAYELARKQANARVERTMLELKEVNGRLAELADELTTARDKAESASKQKSSFLERMRHTALAQGEAIDDTSAAMAELAATFRTVAESVGTLADAAAESGSAARQIDDQGESASVKLSEMVSAVEAAAASLEEMSFSVREVAVSIEQLSGVAEETSSAMNEMQATIAHVEENARHTERLADAVISDANAGAEAVGHTRAGIQEILKLSRMAGQTIRSLGESVQAVSSILDVINEVAEQTQLLSLNAAIIASQAGRQGRGFAVVAGEIKKLADRTSRSTKDIAAVILTVQEESRRAVLAISSGEQAVLDGLERSRDAERALGKIVSSAEESTTMVKGIAVATEQQATGAREVAKAMEGVAMTLAQVASATGEQARGSEMMLNATERLQRLARDVEQVGAEQRLGAKRVRDAVDEVSLMVGQLLRVHDEQTRGTEQIHRSLEAIGQGQTAQIEAIDGFSSEKRRG